MSLKINVVEVRPERPYGDLEPGDIFNYGINDFGAVGLKTNTGHVFLQTALGGVDRYQHITLNEAVPVRFLGKLTGVEVAK